jgi:hypothetical protein
VIPIFSGALLLCEAIETGFTLLGVFIACSNYFGENKDFLCFNYCAK